MYPLRAKPSLYHIAIFITLLQPLVTALLNLNSDAFTFPEMKAAVPAARILRRDSFPEASFSTKLIYSQNNTLADSADTILSTVQIESERPLVVLEDIEQLLTHVECDGSNIILEFSSYTAISKTRKLFSDIERGHIIASHVTCAQPGHRAIFEVYSVSYLIDFHMVVLNVTETSWRDAIKHIRIGYGSTKEQHVQLDHERLYRRQDETTSTSEVTSATKLVPSVDPTELPEKPQQVDLSSELNDTSLTANTGTVIDGFSPFSISCRQCKTTGTLTLTDGEWDIDFDIDDLDLESAFDVIPLGFTNITLEDFSAYMEFQSTPSLQNSFEHTLFTVPVVGFAIPGFGKGGLLFEQVIVIDWKLSGVITMTYGIELEVPRLEISLDFGDPSASTINGLSESTISSLPFQANTSKIELELRVALRPRISLGIDFLGGGLSAGAGVYLDLPAVAANFTQLGSNTVDSKCEALEANATRPSGENEFDFSSTFPSLTHIEAEVELAVGLEFVADAPSLPSYASSFQLASLPVYALPTQCLAFQTLTNDMTDGATSVTAAAVAEFVAAGAAISSASASSSSSSASAAAASSASAEAAASASQAGAISLEGSNTSGSSRVTSSEMADNTRSTVRFYSFILLITVLAGNLI